MAAQIHPSQFFSLTFLSFSYQSAEKETGSPQFVGNFQVLCIPESVSLQCAKKEPMGKVAGKKLKNICE
jgi:hypothetical protein